jgi:trimethylamine--corrinoid protein Co-methyltransferase
MADDLKRKRAGGRAGHAHRAGTRAIDQMPWRIPHNYDRPIEPLGPEGVEAIHKGAMRVLSDIGIRFLNDEALEIFRKAGCKVVGETVFMDEDFVMEMVRKAPSEFTVTPRNEARALPFGGKAMLFGNVSSPPNYWDLERGKVSGFMEGFKTFIKLTQYFNCIHFAGGYPVEPIEVHPSVRHLDCLYEKLTLTDKVVHAYSLGKERVEDAMEMVRIAGGMTHEQFRSRPHMFTNINSVSPLKHDFPMIDGALRLVRAGQAVVVTPFTLAGAMAPVTMSGAVTLSIAEALAAIALLQYVAPGAPVMIGTFTSNVDMKSGAPAFGTPEYMRATQMTGQMARLLWAAAAFVGRLRGQRPGRPGDVGNLELALGGGTVGHQPRLSRCGLARGRADRQPREVRHGLRSAPDDPALHGAAGLGDHQGRHRR